MLNIDRAVSPIVPVPINVDRRDALRQQIRSAEDELETLRLSEFPLRDQFVAALDSLAFQAQRTSFHVRINAIRDGHACLDAATNRVADTERALVEHLEKIEAAAHELEDMRRDFDNDSLWMEL